MRNFSAVHITLKRLPHVHQLKSTATLHSIKKIMLGEALFKKKQKE